MSDPNLGIRGEFTQTAWLPPARLSYDKWSAAGLTLQAIQASHLWWLGDWLAYGHAHYGEQYAQAIEATGHRQETLRGAQWVAERIAPGRRRAALSWTHHKEVASLPIDQADELLERAEVEGLSTRDLRAEVTRRKNRKPTLLQIAGPVTLENQPLGAKPIETENVRRGTVGESNTSQTAALGVTSRAAFIEHWESWLEDQFPQATSTQISDVAEWWWDAIVETGLFSTKAGRAA